MKISPETYSAWSNNSSIRALSSSGGLYSEIAKHLLEQGYAVVGARYREDCKDKILPKPTFFREELMKSWKEMSSILGKEEKNL